MLATISADIYRASGEVRDLTDYVLKVMDECKEEDLMSEVTDLQRRQLINDVFQGMTVFPKYQ